ncbi:MAG: putative Serine/threonine-protein kinase TIO, partial [Streblomastix strix]
MSLAGLTTDNYHILQLAGEGSFGKVYKGRKKTTGQVVAMKFISKINKTPKELRSLRQEIDILRCLNHENIIMLLDTFETDSDFVMVTELGEGDLFEILENDKTLPEHEVQSIAKQLVSALHYLHHNRIIHRDLKPQNILINSSGQIKVCDFGFARALSRSTVCLTSVKGTPLYMPPELVMEQPYDKSADLWSMGIVLYELFVGVPPFYTNNFVSLIRLIVSDPVKYPANMSNTFKDFLKGLLQKKPEKRLTWPALLNHDFVKETKQEREARKLRPGPEVTRIRFSRPDEVPTQDQLWRAQLIAQQKIQAAQAQLQEKQPQGGQKGSSSQLSKSGQQNNNQKDSKEVQAAQSAATQAAIKQAQDEKKAEEEQLLKKSNTTNQQQQQIEIPHLSILPLGVNKDKEIKNADNKDRQDNEEELMRGKEREKEREKERMEKDRLEKDKLEKERIEKEKKDKEEKEKKEREMKQREEKEKKEREDKEKRDKEEKEKREREKK